MIQFDENIAYALGWTVVHSLWQGLIIGVVVGLLFMGLRNRKANLRHSIGLLGLLAMVVVSVITFLGLFEVAETTIGAANIIFIEQVGHVPVIASSINGLESFITHNINGIVLFWALGVFFFALKLMGGYAYIRMLKKQSSLLDFSAVDNLLLRIKTQLNLSRKIEVATSEFIQSPLVVGWLKPVVLFPVGLVNQLSIAELESILAHELAHIYRFDYLMNILQSIVEVLFYYHPVVWWISSKIRQERENSCDDIAVKVGGDELRYAKTLLALQEYAQKAPALAMPFLGKKKLLLHRVQRILNHPQNKNSVMEKLLIMFLMVVTFFSMSISKNSDSIVVEELPVIEANLNMDVAAAPLEKLLMTSDTIPPVKKEKIVVEESNRSVSIKMEDGEVRELIVDGEVISPQSYHLYQDDISKMRNRNKGKRTESLKKRRTLRPSGSDSKEMVIVISPEMEMIEGEDGRVYIVNQEEKSNHVIEVLGEGEDGESVQYLIQTVGEVDEKTLEMLDEAMEEAEFHLEFEENRLEENAKEIEELEEEEMIRMKGVMEEAEIRLEEAQELLESNDVVRGKELSDALALAHTALKNARTENHDVKHDWLQYLLEDGWIKDPKRYKIKFTSKYLKINGKKMSHRVLNRCLDLYEDQNGYPLSKGSKVAISKRDN